MPAVDVTSATAAVTERRRARRSIRRFVRRGTVTGRLPALLLAVGLCVLLAGFLSEHEFTVRSVVVHGNRLAFVDGVVASSGALGQPLFWLDTAAVARRVAAHPAVVSADVRAELPDRVVIRLVEREPVMVWRTTEGSVLVDREGWVVALGDDPSLLHVELAGAPLPEPGQRIDERTVAALQTVASALGQRLAALEYGERTGIGARLVDQRVIFFGSGERVLEQLHVVDAVEAAGVEWESLDVRDPERPVLW